MYLGSNQIGEAGCQELAKSLTNLTSLTALELDLGDNQIGDVGAQTLCDATNQLSNNIKVNINIRDNKITPDIRSKLAITNLEIKL